MNKALVDATRHYCQRHANSGPLISTPVPELILLRRTSPAAVDHAIVQPLLCLVLEGSKEVDIDQRTERYNAGDLMLVARNTPTLTRIAGASVAAPYMSIALDLNIGLLGELIKLHDSAPVSRPQDTRAPLLDAMRRLISLLDDPTSLAALGTGLLREIHHWLRPTRAKRPQSPPPDAKRSRTTPQVLPTGTQSSPTLPSGRNHHPALRL